NGILAFGSIITAAAAWTIIFQDLFPRGADPEGNPNDWSRDELRRWLKKRNLGFSNKDSNEKLLEKVNASFKTLA
ncbi:BgtA-21123, partial [Blumeria graminis f. sp. tritici]